MGAFRILRGRPTGGGGGGGSSFLVPGATAYGSWSGPSQATIDAMPQQGSNNQFGYNQRPVVNWLTPMWQRVGSGGSIDLYLSAKKAPCQSNVAAGLDVRGINRVEFSANGGTVSTVATRSFHPDSGEPCFKITLRESDVPSSGLVEIRATVYPDVGKPFVAWGRRMQGDPNATAISSFSTSDQQAGPRGFAIDPRAMAALDPTSGGTNSFFYGPKEPGTGVVYYNPAWSQDSWSLVVVVDKGDQAAKTIYIDDINGSDSNSGADEAHCVKTWDKVKALWDAAYPGGDYSGLTVLYGGTAGVHHIPHWAAANTNFLKCSKQPIVVGLAATKTKATLQLGWPDAATYNPVFFEKLQLDHIKTVDATWTISNPTANQWGCHAEIICVDSEHQVTRLVTSADASANPDLTPYVGTPWVTGWFGGQSASQQYSGHKQFVRCACDGTAGWEFTFNVSLWLQGTVNNWCPQTDIFDTCKMISGVKFTNCNSKEGIGGMHMDIYQIWQTSWNMSVFGSYCDHSNGIQTVTGTGQQRDTAWDCIYNLATINCFDVGKTPTNIAWFDFDAISGQLTIDPSDQDAVYGDGLYHDCRSVITADVFTIPMPGGGSAWSPSRKPGVHTWNGVDTLESTWRTGKSTLYATGSIDDPADQPATSTEWDYLSAYHILDANLTRYIATVDNGSASTTSPLYPASSGGSDPNYPWLGGGNAVTQAAVSPNFSPANAKRVFYVHDPIHVSNDGNNTWLMPDVNPSTGNQGMWDHNRPLFTTSGLTSGNNTLDFNGGSAETSKPVQGASYLGGVVTASAIQGSGSLEMWAAFQWHTQDTANVSSARIIVGLGLDCELVAVNAGGSTWQLQAAIKTAAGSSFALTDSPGFTLTPGKNYFVRLQASSSSCQLTVFYDGAPTGHAFNGGTAQTYGGSTKNGPETNGYIGLGGPPWYQRESIYNGFVGAHAAMGLNLLLVTGDMSGSPSNVSTTVSKLRTRCGF